MPASTAYHKPFDGLHDSLPAGFGQDSSQQPVHEVAAWRLAERLAERLADPYTGDTVAFQKGNTTSSLVQIDHLVPLALAWQQGAQGWTEDRREAFANDPANLQATDGSTNQQKGASGPGSWLPPNKGYRCEYVARFVLVVDDYELSMTRMG